MALSSVLGVLFTLWATGQACTTITLSDYMPSDVKSTLSDESIFPMKAYMAYDQDNDNAVNVSCYAIDKDFKITAYNSATGLQAYNYSATSTSLTTSKAVITYTVNTAGFLGANEAGKSVTLTLQADANDIMVWEGCADSKYQTNWVFIKNTGSLDNFDEYCLRNVLDAKLGVSSTNWKRKGLC